ncbi:MAG: extracellular solute-binding protein [bacterium]
MITIGSTSINNKVHRRVQQYCKILILLLTILFIPAQSMVAQKQITLRLVDWADLEEIPLDKKAIDAFQKRYPAIRVLYEPNSDRQYEEKILTAFAADDPPDVFLLDSKLIPTFTNKKILLDLTPFIRPLGIDTSQWYPNVLNIARQGNALYAFPKGFTPLMIYYNKKLFRQAGEPFPSPQWDWNQYLKIAQRLTKDLDGDGSIDQYGAAFTNKYYYWICWVWTGGGDVVNPDGTVSSGYLTSSQTQSALQFLIDLQTRHGVAPNTGSWIQSEKTGMNSQLFASDKIAMILDGHWRMPKFLKLIEAGALDIGVAPLPRHPSGNKVNVMYESGWCVSSTSKYQQEAALLAAFMAGEEANKIRASRRLEIPSVRSVAAALVTNDPYGLEKEFLSEIPFCRQPWGSVIERFSEIEWTLQDAVDEVMINHQPMQTTMAQYAKRVDTELKNIRAHETYEFKPIREHAEIIEFLAGVTLFVIAGSTFMYFREKKKSRKETGTALRFLAPSLFHLSVFLFTPILFSAYLSFHRWDIVVPEKPFVGLDNFSELFHDPMFWNALKNTLLFSLNVPLGMVISLSVALLMNQKIKGLSALRTLYFLPSVTSFVAIALVWMWIYHPTFGIANFLLSLFGLGPLQWLNSTNTAMVSIIIFSVWLGLGYQMIIFLAGLQGIPEELLDASKIDGASTWGRFWRITFPLLRPTTFFILVTSLISSFQVFTSIYVMTGGGPVRSTDVLVYHIYQSAWEQLRMGYASAMSWILFIIIMVMTWIQFKVIGRNIEYS